MLLANMSVAKIVADAFPERALLRRHPPPDERKIGDLLQMGQDLVSAVILSCMTGMLLSFIRALLSLILPHKKSGKIGQLCCCLLQCYCCLSQACSCICCSLLSTLLTTVLVFASCIMLHPIEHSCDSTQGASAGWVDAARLTLLVWCAGHHAGREHRRVHCSQPAGLEGGLHRQSCDGGGHPPGHQTHEGVSLL